MGSVAFIEERVLFSPDIPVEVNNILQLAVGVIWLYLNIFFPN
jgi:hypothetical protein